MVRNFHKIKVNVKNAHTQEAEMKFMRMWGGVGRK